ncbi:MAG: glycosyltransferase family 2 protein [Gemmatimonadetes bacterium]|nr:glycosyltransferase family 2 protein [Gemmatimonadota bacterium]
MHEFYGAVQWIFLLYFAGINGGYILLNVLAFFALPRFMQRRVLSSLPRPHTDFEPPVSLIVPAYNEEAVIVSSIRSLLQIDYPEFEIVVVNDGSKDGTLRVLIEQFDLVIFPEAFRQRLSHRPVRRIYRSRLHPELSVVDKENGGSKADALNAGLNTARYPLICPLDADTILQRDSIRLLVQPFLEDPATVGSGGIVRIANGCEVAGGFLGRVGLPRNPLALFQVVEYLRAFLFGRVGWNALDALPLISGAFGLFHKETVIRVGGYSTTCVAEDMELVLRMHRHFRRQRKPYHVTFVADPVCWTEAPEDLRTLRNQRMRWQRGLLQCMVLYRDMLFRPGMGWLGWLALPFLFFFEGLGPILEIAGVLSISFGFVMGWISLDNFALIMAVAIGLGTVLSLTSILLEEAAYHTYPRARDVLVLIVASLLENVGYRQLTAWWRLRGLWQWARRKEAAWGAMVRTGSWQSASDGPRAPRPDSRDGAVLDPTDVAVGRGA